jgi:inorganic pyrophosphatase/exopolyphosphatase
MAIVKLDQNEIISAIERINPKEGSVLLFYVKTDEYGVPLVDVETLQKTADIISKAFEDKGVTGLLLLDKICLFSIADLERAKKRLENVIFTIQEAIDKAGNIENGILEEPAVIDVKNAAGLV